MGIIPPEPQREAEDLRELHPRLDAEILEEIVPRHGPGEPSPDREPALALVDVGNELRGREGLGEAVFALEPERHAVQTVELKPPGIAPEDRGGIPRLPFRIPQDFTGGKTFAHGVEDILHGVGEDARAQEVAHEIRRLHVLGGIGCRLNRHGEARHLQLARGKDRTVVEILLFHLLGKLKIGHGVALLGGKQQGGETARRKVLRRMPGQDLPDPRYRRGGDLFHKPRFVYRVPVGIIQRRHYHAPLASSSSSIP